MPNPPFGTSLRSRLSTNSELRLASPPPPRRLSTVSSAEAREREGGSSQSEGALDVDSGTNRWRASLRGLVRIRFEHSPKKGPVPGSASAGEDLARGVTREKAKQLVPERAGYSQRSVGTSRFNSSNQLTITFS